MDFQNFEQLCKNRRSIRYFDDKPLTKGEILKLIEIATLAPSVENTQPWHFHIVTNPELIDQLTKTSCYGNFLQGAGAFIVVTCDHLLESKAAEPLWNRREMEYSCVAAMENLLLGATAMGLGSCFVSLHHGPTHEILKLSREETIVNGLMLGHYKHGEENSSDGRQRKPLEKVYTFHE